jgi:uncharacterized protein (DUF924 family)
MELFEQILSFWFGRDEGIWFARNFDFDNEIKNRFEAVVLDTSAGNYSDWLDSPRACLARIIVLDQFPRNIYRNSPKAFFYDSLAVKTTKHALSAGYEAAYQSIERCFLYLPLEHSESIEDQKLCVALHQKLLAEAKADAKARIEHHLSYARKHLEIIEKFGRFPHRNNLLGRKTTNEEAEFLKTFIAF